MWQRVRDTFNTVQPGLWDEFAGYVEEEVLNVWDIVGIPEQEMREILIEFFKKQDIPFGPARRGFFLKVFRLATESERRGSFKDPRTSEELIPESFQKIITEPECMVCVDWVRDLKQPEWLGSDRATEMPSDALFDVVYFGKRLAEISEIEALQPLKHVLTQYSPLHAIEEVASGDAGDHKSLEAWCTLGLLRFQVNQL
eukprot:gene20655-31828_t